MYRRDVEQKEKGITNTVLEEQLMNSIPSSSTFENTIIAYEPVWAIGTGLTPTIDEIDETHRFIRATMISLINIKSCMGALLKLVMPKRLHI